MVDQAFTEEFSYTHDNPYHDKLTEFSEFTFRDKEGEAFRGKWNQDVFKREAPLCVEVGSGYGYFMRDYCQRNPHENFIGIDYKFKRAYQLAKNLQKLNVTNYRFLRAKGERLDFLFGENEVDKVFFFFPDPWPKKRHNKKRLFQVPFLKSVYKVLKPGGIFYVKTDHDGYAEWMKEEHEKAGLFKMSFFSQDLRKEHPDHFLSSFETKFEKIFISQGINIKAFVFESKKGEGGVS